MKYNVGDVIIFRTDLEVGELYDDYFYNWYMHQIIVENKYLACITRVLTLGRYRVDIFASDGVVITDAMIAGMRLTADESEMLCILEV